MVDLSVVIPTLNAAAHLPATLTAIGDGPEIIVVDGGSTDGTRDAAPHVRFISAVRGRGSQIAAGIEAAARPWLLLLHADTRLAPEWRVVAAAHIAAGPDHAGYFHFHLDTADPRARRLERVVAWRSRVLGLPYGDQGLLIHRDLLRAVGGITRLPLMEDVDLVRRIGRRRLVALEADALTSAVRWEQDGYLRRSGRNLMCLSLWFVGLPPRLIVRLRMRDTVIVFARAPRLGTVKRRLARNIGDRAALRFHTATLTGLLRDLNASRRFDVVLAVTPDRARFRLPVHVTRIDQGHGALGARMARALRRYRRVALMGCDIPDASATDVGAAFRRLGTADAVFGPAEDGGYWLIALGPRRPSDLFGAARWSTEHALADTLRQFHHFRVGFLRRLTDIDTVAEYRSYIASLD